MAPAADYETLVHKHARVMSSAIRRVLGHRHEMLVPDVEQEVRLALWKRLQTGKKIDYPVSYIYKAALTTALGVMKRLAPEAAPLDEGSMAEVQAGPYERSRDLLPAERARLLEQMLEKLPTDQPIRLRFHLRRAKLYGYRIAE